MAVGVQCWETAVTSQPIREETGVALNPSGICSQPLEAELLASLPVSFYISGGCTFRAQCP